MSLKAPLASESHKCILKNGLCMYVRTYLFRGVADYLFIYLLSNCSSGTFLVGLTFLKRGRRDGEEEQKQRVF